MVNRRLEICTPYCVIEAVRTQCGGVGRVAAGFKFNMCDPAMAACRRDVIVRSRHWFEAT